MKIKKIDGKYEVVPESEAEDLLFQVLTSLMEPLSMKDFDTLIRSYQKLDICESYCQGQVNYKCGLPKFHKGDHVFVNKWSEKEGFYGFDPRKDRAPWEPNDDR